MNQRTFLRTLRRLCLGLMVCAGIYLYQRFEGCLAPGVAGGPVQRVLVDRYAQPGVLGERLLYANHAGILTQGWLVRSSGNDLTLAPDPFIEPPHGGLKVDRSRIRGRVILVLGAAEVPLPTHGME